MNGRKSFRRSENDEMKVMAGNISEIISQEKMISKNGKKEKIAS